MEHCFEATTWCILNLAEILSVQVYESKGEPYVKVDKNLILDYFLKNGKYRKYLQENEKCLKLEFVDEVKDCPGHDMKLEEFMQIVKPVTKLKIFMEEDFKPILRAFDVLKQTKTIKYLSLSLTSNVGFIRRFPKRSVCSLPIIKDKEIFNSLLLQYIIGMNKDEEICQKYCFNEREKVNQICSFDSVWPNLHWLQVEFSFKTPLEIQKDYLGDLCKFQPLTNVVLSNDCNPCFSFVYNRLFQQMINQIAIKAFRIGKPFSDTYEAYYGELLNQFREKSINDDSDIKYCLIPKLVHVTENRQIQMDNFSGFFNVNRNTHIDINERLMHLYKFRHHYDNIFAMDDSRTFGEKLNASFQGTVTNLFVFFNYVHGSLHAIKYFPKVQHLHLFVSKGSLDRQEEFSLDVSPDDFKNLESVTIYMDYSILKSKFPLLNRLFPLLLRKVKRKVYPIIDDSNPYEKFEVSKFCRPSEFMAPATKSDWYCHISSYVF